MIVCKQCGKDDFENYQGLALHITATKSHRKGRKWAAKFLALNPVNKRELPQRVALSEEDKENKKLTFRTLSGKTEYVSIYCPNCKQRAVAILPVEYTHSKFAWKHDGYLVKICKRCGGEV